MSILYAEDDLSLRENTVGVLSDLFAKIDVASDGLEAWALFQNHQTAYDIIITDLNMPHMNGMELIKQVQAINPLQAIVIISAHNETEYFLESIRNSVVGYILKPIDFEQLIDSLYKTASIVKDRKENVKLKTNLQRLVNEKTYELTQSYEKMHDFLTVDTITQLQNATMLYHFLDNFPKNYELTVMLYNIDDFSLITQHYGYQFGDEILSKVAQFLQYNISKEVKLFKYNSDEFVIVFDPKVINPEFIAIQIQAFFRETPIGEFDNNSIYVTLSCGIATSKEPPSLLPFARSALREAHARALPNQFSIYDGEDDFIKKAKNETAWIQKFRVALEEDRVVPFFQPIIDNKTRKIAKYECLARVEDEGEFISPIYFLEAARRSGLMSNLTRSMVNKCFKIFSGNEIEFSLNIANEDLLNDSFIDFITMKQKHYNINSSHVILEILEDIIINNTNPIPIQNLHKLKKLGYKLALDDFGSDRSNFNRLKTIGVDILKIDGQFIHGIDTNEKNQHIVKTITSMAKMMDIEVVAEFIETKAEFETVLKLGIDYSQGYYFNKPAGVLL
ncbi:MAG: EAL domain-containing protein [Campylobacteraceae bacterium]|nr:EAL domain-containing protein [Campylobacteraceae bacterium]